MLFQGKEINCDQHLSADVCIVGSGAGGGVLAKELAEKGISVILLEEGKYFQPLLDFNLREEKMLPKLFQENGGRTTGNLGVTITHGKGIGGSTLHNINLCFRTVPAIVERWQHEDGITFNYEKLIPYFEKVEKTLEINQIKEEQVNTNNLIFREGCEKLGITAKIPFHNRKDCLSCGFCELGCKFDRKQNVAKVYIPLALKAGADIYSDCKVERVIISGRRPTGVSGEIFNRETGRKYKIIVKSKVTVVSAGAIHTPVLLQKSNVPDPKKLIGKTLHLHPYCPVGAVFDREVYGWKGIPQSMYTDDFADFKKTGYGGFTIIPGFAHPGSMAGIVPGSGKEHWEIMKDYVRMAAGGAMVHDETNGTVSVNRFGNPVVNYWPDQEDQRQIIAGFKKTAEIYLAAGAKKVLLPYTTPVLIKSMDDLARIDSSELSPRKVTIMSVHPQSSCRMGENPAKAVVNSRCEMHSLKGLYLCDTSVYPTSLGSPPQVTTMALGTMVADNIRDDYF